MTEDVSPPNRPGMPLSWRLLLLAAVVVLALTAYGLQTLLGLRGQAALGFLCFLLTAAAFAHDLRKVNWRTIGWGLAIQIFLALFILKLQVGGYRPGYQLFDGISQGINKFLEFGAEGGKFVFGKLADAEAMSKAFSTDGAIPFIILVMPNLIFVSAFFTLMQHLGIVQFIVSLLARAMKYLMGTSGAETLAAIENVFMGQSESPLIVRPYVPEMTRSELLALMTCGMATLSGGMIAVYVQKGADAVALLAGGMMSAPCALYLAKLLLPEYETPLTAAGAKAVQTRKYSNALEAIADGASAGVMLLIKMVAMVIAFLSLIALIDYGLHLASPDLSLRGIFGRIFSPVAFLLGLSGDDVPQVAALLGTKLAANEFIAFTDLTNPKVVHLTPRAFVIATYALAGFANFGSIGVQLGVLGTVAENRKADIARLIGRAVFAGFLATLLNAAIAGMLL